MMRTLPPRVYFKHGKYRYRDKQGKWSTLGPTLDDVYKSYYELSKNTNFKPTLMSEICSIYRTSLLGTKSASTQRNQLRYLLQIEQQLGEVRVITIRPSDIYQFLIAFKSVTSNRILSLLSSLFSLSIKMGIIDSNPCREVVRNKETPRNVDILPETLVKFHIIFPKHLQLVSELALLTAQRVGDLLKIKLEDLTEQGIHFVASKTGKKLIVSWTDSLRLCVEQIKYLQKTNNSLYLINNTKGFPYTTGGFRTMWCKYRNKALRQGILTESFTFHDLRAAAIRDLTDEHACSILNHSSMSITKRIYQRAIKVVEATR